MDELTTSAWQILETIERQKKPYAVFHGVITQWMPVDGPRFAAFQKNPERMASFIGIFDTRARLTEIVAALKAGAA